MTSLQTYEGNGVAALVVSHRDEVLEQVELLLANLRSARTKALQEAQSKRRPGQQIPTAPMGGMSNMSRNSGGCVF